MFWGVVLTSIRRSVFRSDGGKERLIGGEGFLARTTVVVVQ